MNEKIEAALEEIRPYIAQHFGDIAFERFENGTVYVKMWVPARTVHSRN